MMTRAKVEELASNFTGNRWKTWRRCGTHLWHRLPLTESGEHFCPVCFTIWNAKGETLNAPKNLASVRVIS